MQGQSATAEALSPPILPVKTRVILRLPQNLSKKDAKPGEPVEFEVVFAVLLRANPPVRVPAWARG